MLSRYLPKEKVDVTAKDHLAGFWTLWKDVISEERQRLVERVVENVSYSKEVKRIREGKQTEWHTTCLELHWSASPLSLFPSFARS